MSKNRNDLKKVADAVAGLKAVAEGTKELFRSFEDIDALHTFQMRKTVEYFNEAAKKAPTSSTAAEKKAIADMIEENMAVMQRLDQSDAEPTKAEEALLVEMETWGQKAESSGEMKLIEDYQASKISEFIAAHPDIWQRLSRTENAFVAKAKQHLKS